ncbi:MAG: kinesin family protein, partial [archaeon]|nr:kinesin family protein [archaeon]
MNTTMSDKNPPCSIITLIKGSTSEQKIKSKDKSPLRKSNTNNVSSNSSIRNRQSSNKKVQMKNNSPNENENITIFTYNHPNANLLMVSSKPISKKVINESICSPKDLIDYNKSVLKTSSIFQFDRVYSQNIQLSTVYDDYIKSNVLSLFHGKNSTVFLFGPKSSGKNHIMIKGINVPQNTSRKPLMSGIIPQCLEDIFKIIDLAYQAGSNAKIKNTFIVKLSAYQIYLDSVYDLLNKSFPELSLEKSYDE